MPVALQQQRQCPSGWWMRQQQKWWSLQCCSVSKCIMTCISEVRFQLLWIQVRWPKRPFDKGRLRLLMYSLFQQRQGIHVKSFYTAFHLLNLLSFISFPSFLIIEQSMHSSTSGKLVCSDKTAILLCCHRSTNVDYEPACLKHRCMQWLKEGWIPLHSCVGLVDRCVKALSNLLCAGHHSIASVICECGDSRAGGARSILQSSIDARHDGSQAILQALQNMKNFCRFDGDTQHNLSMYCKFAPAEQGASNRSSGEDTSSGFAARETAARQMNAIQGPKEEAIFIRLYAGFVSQDHHAVHDVLN